MTLFTPCFVATTVVSMRSDILWRAVGILFAIGRNESSFNTISSSIFMYPQYYFTYPQASIMPLDFHPIHQRSPLAIDQFAHFYQCAAIRPEIVHLIDDVG